MKREVEILTIGDELLRGDLVDTNAAWLAARLARLGLDVTRQVTVGDPVQPLVTQLRASMARCDLVLTTGGLGPTDDDRTCEAVARAAGVERVRDEAVLAELRERFQRAGYPFTANNEQQALFPAGAEVLPNERGTAAGFVVRAGACLVASMPGVPSEMKHMFDAHLSPLLQRELAASPATVRVLRTFGVGESQIDDHLRGLLDDAPGRPEVTLHFRTSFPENAVILVCRGDDPVHHAALLDALEAGVRERLGPDVVFGTDETSFAGAVVAALRDSGATVALAESCTGGLAGDLLTSAPGSSDVFELGVVAYANRIKQQVLGVPVEVLEGPGAVSRECVEAMARGVRELAGATYGVAVSGIAGPGGGTPDKPVGTVHFALARADGVRHLERRFPFDRRRNKLLAAHVALALPMRHALGALPEGHDPLAGRWSPAGGRR